MNRHRLPNPGSRLQVLVATTVLVLIVAGCSSGAESGAVQSDAGGIIQSTAGDTAQSTAASAAASEAVAVAEPPTATPEPATATPEPATATPEPTAMLEPIVTPAATATPAVQVAVQQDQLRVREGPDAESDAKYPIITTVTAGTSFTVLGRGQTSERWIQVQIDDRTGWVFGDYTDLAPEVYEALPLRGWYPPTGVLQGQAALNGTGELGLDNTAGDRDLVYVLTAGEQPLAAVYVRAGDTTDVVGIPYETYTTFTTTGADWNGGSFMVDRQLSRDDQPLVFADESPGWTVTFEVVGGNSSSTDVGEEDFPDVTTDTGGG